MECYLFSASLLVSSQHHGFAKEDFLHYVPVNLFLVTFIKPCLSFLLVIAALYLNGAKTT